MILTTKNSIREALSSGLTINKVCVQIGDKDYEVQKLASLARNKKIKVEYLPKNVLDKKYGKNQGITAETVEFTYSTVDEILEGAENALPFILILDGINDPHNFGAIIRSAECAGVQGIIIPKDRAVAVNDTVIKTSTGAVSNMKIARVSNINNEIEKLKKKGLWVWAAEAGGSDRYKTNLNGPIAVVIGSEGKGVSKLTKEKCDGIISMPMMGKVNSLNASVATGIVLFEILRQRRS